MRNCKLCKLSKACNSLPMVCILMQYVALATLILVMGYLFVTQEILT